MDEILHYMYNNREAKFDQCSWSRTATNDGNAKNKDSLNIP